MASPAVPSKANQKQSTNDQTIATTMNDTPITEEELKKKGTRITINDVLRLNKSTDGIVENIKNFM
jgi:hypothetical protein